MSARPAISVVVPFAGTAADAERVVAGLMALETGPGDELIVVDNSPAPVVEVPPPLRVLRAGRIASSYYARNTGAAEAAADWVLFVDSDCLPPSTLLDDLMQDPVDQRCGIVAGEVIAAEGQGALTARYEAARGHLGVEQHLHMGPSPAGITANLLVRRATWTELDGFREVRSGADVEFCYRAHDAGWILQYRPGARVEHLHTESLRSMLRKARRYGPGQAWVNERYPGAAPKPEIVRQLVRGAGGALVWTVRLQFTRAVYKVLDALWAVAYGVGYRFGSNEPTALPD